MGGTLDVQCYEEHEGGINDGDERRIFLGWRNGCQSV